MTEIGTRTYWHIAHPSWAPGQPLRSRNQLRAHGIDVPWLWDEADEGTDCDIVCLFADTEDGRQEAGWLLEDRPSYHVVRVELPDDVPLTRAEWESYDAVRDEIPAEYLTKVAAIGRHA